MGTRKKNESDFTSKVFSLRLEKTRKKNESMADSMLNRRSRTIFSQLKTLLDEYKSEQVRCVSE